MYIIVTRLTFKDGANRALFLWHTFKSYWQARLSKGNLHTSLYPENGTHYWTKTAWKSKEDAMAFIRSGAHKKAVKLSSKFSSKNDFASWESDEVPGWGEATKMINN